VSAIATLYADPASCATVVLFRLMGDCLVPVRHREFSGFSFDHCNGPMGSVYPNAAPSKAPSARGWREVPWAQDAEADW